MEYLEAVTIVKKVGDGDLLAGMVIISDMIDPPYFRYVDEQVRAYNIVFDGMNKLFNK
jgi:hypothetical protein